MNKLFFLPLIALFLLNSCQTKTRKVENDTEQVADERFDEDEMPVKEHRWESGGLTVYAMDESPRYENATLQINQPRDGENIAAKAIVFDYAVQNFELGKPSEDAGTRGIADSEHGQHIHQILNGQPYTAHYDSRFQKELEPGEYVNLSFLSRSYHESVKHNNAYTITTFTVGNGGEKVSFDKNAPHLFFSRPKDEYKGNDTKRIMLDFYLVNVNLSRGGYHVKANVNGNEFLLTEWIPYIIEGLPMGETTIRLELFDGEGNSVKSPFNPVERKITLKE
jgi:hypothetical protein